MDKKRKRVTLHHQKRWDITLFLIFILRIKTIKGYFVCEFSHIRMSLCI